MLKIIQLQYSSKSGGSVALRLNKDFLEAGIDSGILSLQNDINTVDISIKDLGRNARIFARFDAILRSFITRKRLSQFGNYSFPILGSNISKLGQIKNADVIYMHWVLGGFLNLSNMWQLAMLGKPIIIIMHDMWPITGGCHHSFTCEKYKSRCNNCQIFPKNKMIDLPSMQFDKKLRLYSNFENLYFVSPSKWLYTCAKKSALTKDKPVFHIPNYIDSKVFKPIEKKIARHILNLKIDETIIAFGAIAIDSPYKGWAYLQKALKILSNYTNSEKISVLVFGSGFSKQIADSIPFKTRFMGYLHDEYSTALVYNAADVFVVPSLADNLPTTILECLGCGTPVVGFDVGGIPDMIKHKENGYLAIYRDSDDLARGISFCIDKKIKGEVSPDFGKDVIISKHIELMNAIRLNAL